MNINLNVNDLVEQITELTRQNTEAIRKASDLASELADVKDQLMKRELEEYDKQLRLEREFDEMAKEFESVELKGA